MVLPLGLGEVVLIETVLVKFYNTIQFITTCNKRACE